jgi:hypothetical protein
MRSLEPGDIVQVNPACSHGRTGQWFNGCLVVVSEVKPWGVQGYVQNAGQPGQAYIRLRTEDFEPTGGKAVWNLE